MWHLNSASSVHACRAKKAAEIAKAAAKDLVVQAATEEGPEQDAEDIIDMTAAAEQVCNNPAEHD